MIPWDDRFVWSHLVRHFNFSTHLTPLRLTKIEVKIRSVHLIYIMDPTLLISIPHLPFISGHIRCTMASTTTNVGTSVDYLFPFHDIRTDSNVSFQDDVAKAEAEQEQQFDLRVRGEAREYLLHWIHVREVQEGTRRAHRLSLPSPPPSPPSQYSPGNSPVGSRIDPPFWFSQFDLVKQVQDDLAEADAMGLTVDETKDLYPYLLGRCPFVTTPIEKSPKKSNNASRDARAAARTRRY